jgi:alkylation response protein AidB-like acyl-CoA dehydrogenase
MDTRDSPEQAELRRAARQLARELGPTTVADLDDSTRSKRLAAAVHDAGWLELRDGAEDGGPLASGVEASILAEGLAERVADTSFTGAVLARDLARRAGAQHVDGTGVACSSDLLGVAVVDRPATTTALHVVDTTRDGSDAAYVLFPEGDGHRLALVPLDRMGDDARDGVDLTRTVQVVAPGATRQEIADQGQRLSRDDLVAWNALGLALTSADLVGLMRGVLDVSVAYASERRQFGVAVGSFQAVQHLLAEARCLLEGSHSVTLHASWAVDSLPATDACAAGRVAKAYCARAARTVCEAAIQVHGGIGNTWECIVHVYLRRALLSSLWFGDDGEQLRRLEHERLGVPAGGADGLS